MPHITVCSICKRLYEESGEEQANAPLRVCMDCWSERHKLKRGNEAVLASGKEEPVKQEDA